jgi:hypothetical protein
LNLEGNNIGDKGIIALCKMMTVNDSISFLNVSHNKISDDGGKAIAEMFRYNTKVNVFFMRWN